MSGFPFPKPSGGEKHLNLYEINNKLKILYYICEESRKIKNFFNKKAHRLFL